MIRRTSIFLFELLAGLLTGLVILMGIGAWFLSSGPISLTFLTPIVERALDSVDDSYTIRVEDTVLTWAGWQRAVDIRANNVTIQGEGGSIEVTLPEVSVGFSLRALVRGSVTPTSLDIIAPKVSVIRSREGRVVFGLISDSEGGETSFNRIVERLIDQLLGPADIDRPLSHLRSVSVLGADLTFDDRMLGVSWRAPLTNVVLQRNAIGLGVDADLYLEVGGQQSRITGEMSFDRLGNTISLAFRFRDVNPALIANGAPRLALLSVVDMPVSGSFGVQMQANGQLNSLAFSLDSLQGRLAGEATLANDGIEINGTIRFQEFQITEFTELISRLAPMKPLNSVKARLDGNVEFKATTGGRIDRIKFDVSAGAGVLDLPSYYSKPIAITGMRLRGDMIDDMSRLRIDDSRIELGGPAIMFKGSAAKLHDDFQVQFGIGLSEIQIRGVKELWPDAIMPKSREWVTKNIIGGLVSKIDLSLTARLIGGDVENIDIESIGGSMNVQGTSINYHSRLPSFTDVDGVVTFSNDQFNIDISRAYLRDITIENASVKFDGPTVSDERVTINLHLRGPVGTVATILDQGSIALSDDFELDPQEIKGEMDAHVKFDFPISNSLVLEEIAVSADGRITDTTINETSYGLALTNGDLKFHADNQGIEATGRVRLNGVQATLFWKTYFNPESDIRSRIGLMGKVNDRERDLVGIIPIPFLTGPIYVDIDLTEHSDGSSILVVDSDITQAVVDIGPIDWRKQSREQGKFELFMVTEPNGSIDIKSFSLDSGDLNVLARIVPKPDLAGISHIEFDKLQFAGNDISAVVDALPEGGYRIVLDGKRLDVAQWLKRRQLPDMPYTADRQGVPIVIQANIDEVTDGPNRRLTNVSANGRYDGQDWQAFIFDAEVGNGGRLELSYQPVETGYSLRILSDDAGQALNSLNWTDRAQNGALVLTGIRASLVEPMVGSFKVTDYRLIEAPALARLLQVASLTGILSALSQHGGLEFVTLDGDFSYQQGKLEISNTRTYGSSIGVTVEGSFDLEQDTVNIKGTIIPAYTINRVLGVIPVLGRLLTGGKDEGVFAATYKVKGSIENPTITANPLLALAPGFLRSLLGLLGEENSKSENVVPIIPDETNEGKESTTSDN